MSPNSWRLAPELDSAWVSTLLTRAGVPHFFSRKLAPSADTIAHRLAGACARPARAKQVHGARFVRAQECLGPSLPEADAVLNDSPALVPMVTSADCVSVLIWCAHSKSCAAVHAGWRGLIADSIGAAVRGMIEQFGAEPSAMVAALGPCAGADAYEVGGDVIDEFVRHGLGTCVREGTRPGKALADCALAARLRLRAAGLADAAIEASGICTISDVRCASHRRESTNPARMLSAIAIPV